MFDSRTRDPHLLRAGSEKVGAGARDVKHPDAGPSLFACGLTEKPPGTNRAIWTSSFCLELSLENDKNKQTAYTKRARRAPGVPTIIFLKKE